MCNIDVHSGRRSIDDLSIEVGIHVCILLV
jgi:hypothetical protein